MALGSDGRDYVGMVLNNAMFTCDCRDVVLDIFAWVCFLVKAFATMLRIDPVSYTHLTLPTIYSV